MEKRTPIHRTDEQLKMMLDEPGTWVVHGHGDRVFGVGGCLRRAIDRASNYAQSGAIVVAVARVPPNRIFVFHDQLVRLIAAIREEELGVSADADLLSA
ncbi:MAG: hypothetical protein ABSE20_03400 [Acetobacteraceae bacterium]|jgi:hypothetical protein